MHRKLQASSEVDIPTWNFFNLRASQAASYIPGSHVVIVTTGLVWDQKGQTHSTLNSHMENIDLLISEEAQQRRFLQHKPLAIHAGQAT